MNSDPKRRQQEEEEDWREERSEKEEEETARRTDFVEDGSGNGKCRKAEQEKRRRVRDWHGDGDPADLAPMGVGILESASACSFNTFSTASDSCCHK